LSRIAPSIRSLRFGINSLLKVILACCGREGVFGRDAEGREGRRKKGKKELTGGAVADIAADFFRELGGPYYDSGAASVGTWKSNIPGQAIDFPYRELITCGWQ